MLMLMFNVNVPATYRPVMTSHCIISLNCVIIISSGLFKCSIRFVIHCGTTDLLLKRWVSFNKLNYKDIFIVNVATIVQINTYKYSNRHKYVILKKWHFSAVVGGSCKPNTNTIPLFLLFFFNISCCLSWSYSWHWCSSITWPVVFQGKCKLWNLTVEGGEVGWGLL